MQKEQPIEDFVKQWKDGAVAVSDAKLKAHLLRLKVSKLPLPQARASGVPRVVPIKAVRDYPNPLLFLSFAALIVILAMWSVAFVARPVQGERVVVREKAFEVHYAPVINQTVINQTTIVEQVDLSKGRECTQIAWQEGKTGEPRFNLVC